MKLKDNNDPKKNPNINWAPLLTTWIDFCNYKTIVEIGVQQGETTEEFCKIAQKIGGKVFGYDFFDKIGAYGTVGSKVPPTPPLETIREKLFNKGYDDNVLKLTKIDTSTDEFVTVLTRDLKKYRKRSIDFAFIDGCHSYEGVKNDFLKVYPLLSPEGTIVFHDTFSHAGPRKFVLELYEENDGTYDIIHLPFGGGPGTQPYGRIGIAILTKRSFAWSEGGIHNTDHDNPPLDEEEIYKNEKEWYERQLEAARDRKK